MFFVCEVCIILLWPAGSHAKAAGTLRVPVCLLMAVRALRPGRATEVGTASLDPPAATSFLRCGWFRIQVFITLALVFALVHFLSSRMQVIWKN